MFKIGDKVVHVNYGKGKISDYFINCKGDYSFVIIFDNGDINYVTKEGSLIEGGKRVIYFCGSNGEFLEERPKEGVKKRKEFNIIIGRISDQGEYIRWLNSYDSYGAMGKNAKMILEWEEEVE